MAFDYASVRATADRLITRFGAPLSLRRYVTSGESDNPVRTPEIQTITAAVFDYRSQDIDGTVILAGDMWALVKAGGLAWAPAKGQQVDRAGETWRVESAETISPAGTNVVWILRLRK
ncbi:hypothetical protein [Microbaculum marinum]|uniref:Uncharacterized protein n=1 Tax=Microbaculum marinum TaxID=1764581 RepID=A0AAW9RN49_9HYPH